MQKGLFFFSILFLFSCTIEKTKYQSLNGMAFGTTYSIRYDDAQNRNFTLQIDSLIYSMNKSLSTYISGSDISKINSGDTTIVIDQYFKEVFLKSNRIYDETNGFFDPTVGTLVNAWGFGPKDGIVNLNKHQIDSLMQFVGFDKVKLVDSKIEKEFVEIYFDFNAIAKGYGIDLIGRFLEEQNCKNYLIELGGEIRARGVSEKGDFWKAAIEDPNTDGSRSYSKIVKLENQSMASSGNYRKFKIDKDGRKFVHTINPTTGYAKESDLLSATIIANIDCADVDAYATACMAMGLEKTKLFLKNHPELNAFLIFTNSNGELETYSSENPN